METNVNLLNVIYENADMGIVGINKVLDKTNNPKLIKELLKEKKYYTKILKNTKKMILNMHGEVLEIKPFAKIGSEIYSDIKLMNKDSDKIIIKMMIEGIYKSIGILTTKKIEYVNVSKEIDDYLDDFIKNIKRDVNTLMKISSII